MNANINLLLQTNEESKRRQKRVKRLNIIAYTFLIGVGCLSLVIFLLIQIVNVSAILREQNEIIKKISKSQNKQAKLFVLNNRIDNIEKILGKRIDLSKVMSGLLAKMPSRLSIEDMEVNDKTVTLTAKSTSLLAIGELINNLTDMVRKKEIINSLILNTLTFDESNNSYQVSIESEVQI